MTLSKLKYLSILGLLLSVCSCQNNEAQQPEENKQVYFEIDYKNTSDTLFRVPRSQYYDNQKFCYLNQKGDTVIPYGKFHMSFSDTITRYGVAIEKTGETYDMIGINKKGQRLYEIHWFDNGQDLMSDNTFRIIRNGKIGYADKSGKIIIKPQYACAYPFENGSAKVTYDCNTFPQDPTPKAPESDTWFYINKKGEKLK